MDQTACQVHWLTVQTQPTSPAQTCIRNPRLTGVGSVGVGVECFRPCCGERQLETIIGDRLPSWALCHRFGVVRARVIRVVQAICIWLGTWALLCDIAPILAAPQAQIGSALLLGQAFICWASFLVPIVASLAIVLSVSLQDVLLKLFRIFSGSVVACALAQLVLAGLRHLIPCTWITAVLRISLGKACLGGECIEGSALVVTVIQLLPWEVHGLLDIFELLALLRHIASLGTAPCCLILSLAVLVILLPHVEPFS